MVLVLLLANAVIPVKGPDIHAAVASLAASTSGAVFAPVVATKHRTFTVNGKDLEEAFSNASKRLGLKVVDPHTHTLGFAYWPRELVDATFRPLYSSWGQANFNAAIKPSDGEWNVATSQAGSVRCLDVRALPGLDKLQVHWFYEDILVAGFGKGLAAREIAKRVALAVGAHFVEEGDIKQIAFDADIYRSLLAGMYKSVSAAETQPFFRTRMQMLASVAAELDIKVISEVMKERGGVRERFYLLPKDSSSNAAIDKTIAEIRRTASAFAPDGSLEALNAARLARMDTEGQRRVMFVEPGTVMVMVPGKAAGYWMGI